MTGDDKMAVRIIGGLGVVASVASLVIIGGMAHTFRDRFSASTVVKAYIAIGVFAVLAVGTVYLARLFALCYAAVLFLIGGTLMVESLINGDAVGAFLMSMMAIVLFIMPALLLAIAHGWRIRTNVVSFGRKR